mgnify:FL=1
MNLLNLVIDSAKTVGHNLLLTDIRPFYEYDGNNQRLDKISGYKYEVTLPERKFEKISVKIAGNQRVSMDDSCDYMPVVFDDLQLKLYWTPSGYNISATAKNVRVQKKE